MRPFVTVKVDSIGREPARGFVTRADGSCGVGTLNLPVYPPHPRGEELSTERVRLGLSLRRAATLLGLSPIELGSLEHGRMTFAAEGDWERAAATWRCAAEE